MTASAESKTSGPKPPHPLGPLVTRTAPTRPKQALVLAAVVLCGCIGVLGLALSLTPSRRGLGTHQQLGFPPCTFVVMTGYPCPTCGMTTAFSNAVRGRFISAFLAQPAGLLLACATAATAGMSLTVIVTGKVWKVNWYRVRPQWVTVAIVAFLGGGWAFKIVAGIITGNLPARGW